MNHFDRPAILKKMHLDIISLDVDGVLNPDKNERRDVFDPACAQQLHRILDARPEVRVFFSTTCAWGIPSSSLVGSGGSTIFP